MERTVLPARTQFARLAGRSEVARGRTPSTMSVVAFLDLATFAPSEGRAPEPIDPPARFDVEEDVDDDVWDEETVDETPEDLEALILAAREDREPA